MATRFGGDIRPAHATGPEACPCTWQCAPLLLAVWADFFRPLTPCRSFPTLPPNQQAWFKNRNQMGQRAQGWHTQTFVERSRFLKQGNRWLYVDGDQDWKR